MDKMMDRDSKRFYLDRLQREIRELEEKEQKLQEQLKEISALRKSKEEEREKLTDDRYTSETLARVYEQRRNRK